MPLCCNKREIISRFFSSTDKCKGDLLLKDSFKYELFLFLMSFEELSFSNMKKKIIIKIWFK